MFSELEQKPYVWCRYINDIVFLWEHGEENLEEFIEHLNAKKNTIKFIREWSQTSINFSDVTVSPIRGKITIDLYCKPTNNHQYLNSSYVTHIAAQREFPYSQAFYLFDKNVLILKSG